MDYHRQNNVDIRIVRIFNTYGPRMLMNDGRVVSNFIVQALKGEDAASAMENAIIADVAEEAVGNTTADSAENAETAGSSDSVVIADAATAGA